MALFDQPPYGQPSSSSSPPQQPNSYYHQQPALQFFSSSPSADPSASFYPGSRSSLEGNVAPVGNLASGGTPNFGGNIQGSSGPWWTAFGSGGFEGEAPLLEELGVNFSHIQAKSLTVLNPLRRIDEHIMDDADMAGPILFCFALGAFLLMSGKPQFGYIYGVGVFGACAIYTLLNLMSESGIDAYRVASVLGYCLLPMVGVGAISVCVGLDGALGYILSLLSILWCTYAASGIFVAVLRMTNQRFLVAYPVGLFYGCFALFSVFNVGAAK